MFAQLLVIQQNYFSSEMLVWAVGILLLLGAVALYFYQRKEGKKLTQELSQLAKIQKHNIEFEFVLKAMKLCTWHIDVQKQIIIYANDYRERSDCFVPTEGTTLEDLVNYGNNYFNL